MKVLQSAYACEPGKGSEPEAGFRTLLAAASEHDVWVITRRNNLEPLERALASVETRDRIHVVGIDLGPPSLRIKRLGPVGLQLYYSRWQRAAGEVAEALHHDVGFDVCHHVTFASYWGRIGIAGLDVPLVVGPVGGGVRTPRRLMPVLGIRGLLAEAARATVRALAVRNGSAFRSAAVVLVQNLDTARRVARLDDAVVLPNALAIDIPAGQTTPQRSNEIAFVGRLVPWKAARLAVRALSHLPDSSLSLHIYGEGPDRRRLERSARRMRLTRRVVFEGELPRAQLRERVAASALLLHPALHEEAGFAVAEALAAGTPVVCLDHGGPAELVRCWPATASVSVPSGTPRRVARRLAGAASTLVQADGRHRGGRQPVIDYGRAILDAYARATAVR